MVLDAPLLYETKVLEYICFPIVVVAIDRTEKQIQRLMERNKDLSKEEGVKKITSQMPMAAKVAKADIVVNNSGSKEGLEQDIL